MHTNFNYHSECPPRPTLAERTRLMIRQAHIASRMRRYRHLLRDIDCTLYPEGCHFANGARIRYGSCRCTGPTHPTSEDEYDLD